MSTPGRVRPFTNILDSCGALAGGAVDVASAAQGALTTRLSRSPRLRHLEAGAALYLTDQRADVVVGRALKHRVLVDEARRLADPHRHAQLLALRDGEIDILHQDMHCGSVAERAIQYRIRHHRERRAIAAAARIDRVHHDLRI